MTRRTASWYYKPAPTFADAVALVRSNLWMASHSFSTSPPDPDRQEVPADLHARLVDAIAYAA